MSAATFVQGCKPDNWDKFMCGRYSLQMDHSIDSPDNDPYRNVIIRKLAILRLVLSNKLRRSYDHM